MVSTQTLPSSQEAVRQGDNGQIYVDPTASIPSLLPGYVLVKTRAVALNPSDHKICRNFPISGAYVGCDFSGVVVDTGDNDTLHLYANRVVSGCAYSFASQHRLASGAFAEYVRARADLLFQFPAPAPLNPPSAPKISTLGAFEAATLGIAVSTCILAFWSPDALNLNGNPEHPRPLTEPPVHVLVNGGSTATGTIALQLLRLSGYDPITTCSPRNFDLVRDRGASAVFDYSAVDVVAKIKAHTGGHLKYVLDCISDASSASLCYDVIQRPGGWYASLEPIGEEILAKRKAVRAKFVLAAEGYGEDVQLGHESYDRPANAEKHDLVVHFMSVIQRLLDDGALRAHPIEIVHGGLRGVVEGLEALASGSISGKKLVAGL